MATRYEHSCLVTIAHRLASGFPARSVVALELSNWVEGQDLGFAWEPDVPHSARKGVPRVVWDDLRACIARQLPRASRARPDALARTIAALSTHMGLTSDESQIFALATRAAQSGPLRSLCNSLVDDARLPIEEAVMHLCGISPARVRKALAPAARLLSSGLLHHETPPLHGLGLQPSDRLMAALQPPSRGLHDVLARLFAEIPPAETQWDDFTHLGPGRDFAFRLLRGAMRQREKGVNLLLHGAPGTGKTEFCKILADRLGARLHAVGERDDDGDEPSRFERLQQLRLGQKLLSDQPHSLILFDELEDLLPSHDGSIFGLTLRRSGSKVHMNRLLETNPVPTLWTTNDISACDPALLRRMSFTLELRTPPATVRARIWQRLAARHRMPLPQALCLDLANGMEDAPALAGSALRAARIARGGTDDIRLVATALSRAVRGGHTPPVSVNPGRFDPGLAHADHDLDLVTDRLIAHQQAHIGGLCLSGPPGTGKSAFARYLADRIGMPLLERRASDLLDRYVGGSERNIAAAFAEARDTGAFLIFDEADTLLGTRAGATHRWEISQVNEMLTWMDSHPLPFACTTNLVDQLDPATARRFSLRIVFLPLTLAQRRACYRRFFQAEPPPDLRLLDQLTPGDFAVVARRVTLLGLTEAEAIMAELRREQEAKPGTRTPAGFRAAC
jgi:transitional endoplasmic reticulum ATPase